LPVAFFPEQELILPVFRLVAAASLIWPVFLALIALTAYSFRLPHWFLSALWVVCGLSFWGTGLDLYWIKRLYRFDDSWTVLDQGDHLILRCPH
jgi:hypothetical protein